MTWITEPEAWIALATLTLLEVVLGIDNIVFISILTGRLPEHHRSRARKLGLGLALLMRVALLSMLSWVMRLEKPWFTALGSEVSGRDVILMAGGLFLLAKSTLEIHHNLEGGHDSAQKGAALSFSSALLQIMLLDVIFSLDSVITAVGMARHLPVMIIAIVLAMIVMVLFVDVVCDFVERHPTFKILALSFLLLIGLALVGEGLELHIPKGYIYFAMGFSLFVELLNLKLRPPKKTPVHLRGPTLPES